MSLISLVNPVINLEQGGTVQDAIKYITPYMFGAVDSPTADNTSAIRSMFQAVSDNTVVDFCGVVFRVYASVTGVPSSTATPATTDALAYEDILKLVGVKNVTLRDGGVYVANAGVSPVKRYFPSALSFIDCENITLNNITAEAKGESWGDADASVAQSKSRRLVFLGTNGGHAFYFGRCRGVFGTITARLCGSTGPVYFSSCDNVNLENSFSNPASLGYAAFCADAWVGTLADVGLEKFRVTLVNPLARRETLYRREDGTTPVGSAIYCGKGGCLTEDPGVYMQTIGGEIENMYGNGTAKVLGYAFGAASGSTVTSVGARVRDCQEVGFLTWSSNNPANLYIDEVDAETGLTGILVDFKSFGTGYARLTGTIKVSANRAWSGESTELSQSSLVACLKTTSEVFIDLGLRMHPDSNVYALINNSTRSCGGGVKFLYGTYITNGYLMLSQGWGSGVSGSTAGLVDCGSTFHDKSAVTTALIQYRNLSTAGVYTYIHHDMRRAKISAASTRPVDSYTISGTALDEVLLFSRPVFGAYVSNSARVERTNTTLRCVSVDGLVGSNTAVTFNVQCNHDVQAGARVVLSNTLLPVLAGAGTFSTGSIKYGVSRQYLFAGDVRSSFTPGTSYTCLGA